MRRTNIPFLALALAAGSLTNAQDVGLLHLGALRLQFPPTWTFDFSKHPIEGRGPNGEVTLITTETRKDAGTPDGERAVKSAVDDFAKGPMAEIAGKHGMKTERLVTPFTAPPGHVAFSSVAARKSLLGVRRYFIQYIFGGSGELIYITVEGEGDASIAVQQLDLVMSTQQWTDGP